MEESAGICLLGDVDGFVWQMPSALPGVRYRIAYAIPIHDRRGHTQA